MKEREKRKGNWKERKYEEKEIVKKEKYGKRRVIQQMQKKNWK